MAPSDANDSNLEEDVSSWGASAQALLKTAFEGPTVILNKELLTQMDNEAPFSSATAIVDLGCGAGQVLGHLLAPYGPEIPLDARMIATDISQSMIDVVESRKRDEICSGHPIWERVETEIWDAQDLVAANVPDETFSHIAAGLLLLTVPRPRDVLSEVKRVLKSSDGVFGMTSFQFAGWMEYVEEGLKSVRPGTTLASVPLVWASVGAVRRQLEDAGFRDVKVKNVQTPYEFTDPEMVTRYMMSTIPTIKAATSQWKREEVDEAVSWVVRRLRERFPEGKGYFDGIAIVATAKK